MTITCDGIEQDPMTFKGSELFLRERLKENKKLNEKNMPFIPIHGDAYDLEDFVGARIVYIWLKGATPDLLELMITKFLEDENAMYLVTHATRNHFKGLQTLRYIDNYDGGFSCATQISKMHIYAKHELDMDNSNIKPKNREGLSEKIAKAYLELQSHS